MNICTEQYCSSLNFSSEQPDGMFLEINILNFHNLVGITAALTPPPSNRHVEYTFERIWKHGFER
jgi:hypothetical protein